MEPPFGDGYVKTYRRLRDHPIWRRERFTWGQVWIDLILLAAHENHPVMLGTRTVQVKRGQVITSQARLAREWGWTRETVGKFLR